MSAERARNEMQSVLLHDLDACPEVDDIVVYPGSLNDAWVMPYHSGTRDVFFRMWFLQHFASRDQYAVSLRINQAVDSHYSAEAKMHYEDTGEATRVNPRFTRALKARLLTAQWPSWKSVVDAATQPNAMKAQRNLQRLVVDNGIWLEKS
jgi:hypothetical protein